MAQPKLSSRGRASQARRRETALRIAQKSLTKLEQSSPAHNRQRDAVSNLKRKLGLS